MLMEQVKSESLLSKLTQTGLRWVFVAVIAFALDRISKCLALHYLIEYTPQPVIPFFNFTLLYNHGAAFSFLDQASGWQMWLFGLVALLISISILVWLSRLSYQKRWVSIALALILGGAIGNLYDRIAYGYVIDFIDWYVSYYHWPVFNIADAAVCIGAFMLIFDVLKKPKVD